MSTFPDHASKLLEKVRNHESLVGVIGLGYVGLPLLDAYVRAGFSTMGFDVDSINVDRLNHGGRISPISRRRKSPAGCKPNDFALPATWPS